MDSNNSSGRAGRHGRIGARGPGKGRMPGFRSTIHYKQTKGPDGWRIPNLDRSTVFYRPNQTSTPSPPVGNKRPAVSAPDAGDVELQPRPLGTMSGGEGQAGWACELASQKEMISKQRNVQSRSILWVCGLAVIVMLRLWRALQQRLRTACKVGTLCVLSTINTSYMQILRSTAAAAVVRVSQNERKARPR